MTELMLCLVAAIPTAGLHPTTYGNAVARAEAVAAIWPAEVKPEREWCRRLWAESSYRMWPVGKKLEVGISQLLPATAAWLCADLAWDRDPTDNIRCGNLIWRRGGRRACRYTGRC
jgi:hypothetical protein